MRRSFLLRWRHTGWKIYRTESAKEYPYQQVPTRDFSGLAFGEMQVEAIAELETLACIKQLNLICRSLQGLIDYSYVWVSGIQRQIIAPVIFLFNNNHTRAKIASSWLVAPPDGMLTLRRRVWYAEGCE